MGREITGVKVEKKPNGVVVASNGVSHDKVHVAPKISEESFDTNDYEVKECTEENSVDEKFHEEQEVLGVKGTNLDEGLIEGENEKVGAQKSNDNKKSSSPASKSPAVGNVHTNYTVPQPFALATEKRGPCTHAVGTETSILPSTNSVLSPNASKNSQVLKSSCDVMITWSFFPFLFIILLLFLFFLFPFELVWQFLIQEVQLN